MRAPAGTDRAPARAVSAVTLQTLSGFTFPFCFIKKGEKTTFLGKFSEIHKRPAQCPLPAETWSVTRPGLSVHLRQLTRGGAEWGILSVIWGAEGGGAPPAVSPAHRSDQKPLSKSHRVTLRVTGQCHGSAPDARPVVFQEDSVFACLSIHQVSKPQLLQWFLCHQLPLHPAL